MYVTFHISGNLFTLRKEGHVCGDISLSHDSPERKVLGHFDTVTECALACKAHATCKHFSYGRWKGLGIARSRRCNWEKTTQANCPVGFVETDDYDLYALSGNI